MNKITKTKGGSIQKNIGYPVSLFYYLILLTFFNIGQLNLLFETNIGYLTGVILLTLTLCITLKSFCAAIKNSESSTDLCIRKQAEKLI